MNIRTEHVFPPMEATEEQLRQAGFTKAALAYPRDEVALRLLCAFVGVDWKAAPPGWWSHPNESTKEAWKRVADEARLIFSANAASVLAGKAKELRGIGNGTADLMARIFEEQVDAIMTNSRPAEPVS